MKPLNFSGDSWNSDLLTTILQVPVESNIQSCLQAFLTPDTLQGEKLFYFHVCNSSESAVVSQYLSSSLRS